MVGTRLPGLEESAAILCRNRKISEDCWFLGYSLLAVSLPTVAGNFSTCRWLLGGMRYDVFEVYDLNSAPSAWFWVCANLDNKPDRPVSQRVVSAAHAFARGSKFDRSGVQGTKEHPADVAGFAWLSPCSF